MKQFNFSNLIALVAILLCFYAFSNDKASPQQEEKEFCLMRIDATLYKIDTYYSDGKFENEDIKALMKENGDLYGLKISYKRMTEMTNSGWDFVGINKDWSPYATTYIFERSK